MIGYPITYGDLLEEKNVFTTHVLETKVVDYWNNDRKSLFFLGYKHGTLIFSATTGLLVNQPALVQGSCTDTISTIWF